MTKSMVLSIQYANKSPHQYAPLQQNRNTRHYSSMDKQDVSHSQYSKPSDTLNVNPHQFTATTQLHKELLSEMPLSDDLKPFTPDITGYGTDVINNNIPSTTKKAPPLMQITSRNTTHAPHTSHSCHDSYINHLKRRPKIQYFQRGCIEDI